MTMWHLQEMLTSNHVDFQSVPRGDFGMSWNVGMLLSVELKRYSKNEESTHTYYHMASGNMKDSGIFF